MSRSLLGFTLLTLALLPSSVAAASTLGDRIEITTDIESEFAFETEASHVQKSTLVVSPEFSVDLQANARLTSIVRLRADFSNSLVPGEPLERAPGSTYLGDSIEIELREFYVDSYLGDNSLRVGKQQIVWGQADGLRVLDLVNPLDFREFILADFEQRRIPLWTVNYETPLGEDWFLQFLWVLDQTYDLLPKKDSSYSITSKKLVPILPEAFSVSVNKEEAPGRFFKDSDVGLRLTSFLGGWDLSLNYLYHYQDQAVLYRSIVDDQILVTPSYERTHLVGGSFSNAFGDLTLRGEVGFSSDRYFVTHDPLSNSGIFQTAELSYVAGLDYTINADFLLSGQFFQSIVRKQVYGAARDRLENQLTLLVKNEFLNDTLSLETLVIHSTNDDDGLIQTELKYQLTSNVMLSTGFDIFYGTADGVFGQFDQRDRFTLGLHIGL